MATDDIARKRSVLVSTRMRFSPQTQSIRETAIDKIVEQNLLLASGADGLTLREVEEQGTVCFANGISAISRLDLQNSLDRLVKANRIIVTERTQKRYHLSEQVRQELWELQKAAEARLSRVVNRLFKNAKEGATTYSEPFLECLCILFSQLGEAYVRLIKGDHSANELLSSPSVFNALREIHRKYPTIDPALLKAAVFSFFGENEPDYSAIKWNMAQNYYVAKALGLDPSGYLLSKEVFDGAAFYLDTNVVIDALESKTRYYESFKALSRACHELGIQMYVCQVSLDELRRVVEDRIETIQKVAPQIPDEILPKVNGVFFQLYRERLASTGTVCFDDLFANFTDPLPALAQDHGVELVDDVWFVTAEDALETDQLIRAIKWEYKAKRGREKGVRPALHDALLIRWIQREREEGAVNTWLVTLDASLPGLAVQQEDVPHQSLAITLDALLQWISPIAMQEDAEQLELIFSEAVKRQLLPQESFFELRDFLVFAEMEWACKELPAQDVEECIRYLKTNAPNLDPSDPIDREKMAHEVSRFFADPGRKYKQEVQRLETESARKEAHYRRELEDRNQAIRERDEMINQLQREQAEHQHKDQQQALKKSAQTRLIFVILLVIAYELAMGYLAGSLGAGANLFQRLIGSWPSLTLGFGVAILLSRLVIGKDRLHSLGWSFANLFKVDSEQ